MKKNSLLIMLALAWLCLAGCRNDAAEEVTPAPSAGLTIDTPVALGSGMIQIDNEPPLPFDFIVPLISSLAVSSQGAVQRGNVRHEASFVINGAREDGTYPIRTIISLDPGLIMTQVAIWQMDTNPVRGQILMSNDCVRASGSGTATIRRTSTGRLYYFDSPACSTYPGVERVSRLRMIFHLSR